MTLHPPARPHIIRPREAIHFHTDWSDVAGPLPASRGVLNPMWTANLGTWARALDPDRGWYMQNTATTEGQLIWEGVSHCVEGEALVLTRLANSNGVNGSCGIGPILRSSGIAGWGLVAQWAWAESCDKGGCSTTTDEPNGFLLFTMSANTPYDPAVIGNNWAHNSFVWLRASVLGSTILGKIWPYGGDEPKDWPVSVGGSTPTQGAVGIYSPYAGLGTSGARCYWFGFAAGRGARVPVPRLPFKP